MKPETQKPLPFSLFPVLYSLFPFPCLVFPLPCLMPPALQNIPGPFNVGLAAEGAAGGSFEALPFFEDKAALPAAGRDNGKGMVRSRGLGHMVQVVQDFFFRQGQQLGQFPHRAVLFLQQDFQGLSGSTGLIVQQGAPCVI